MSYSSGLRRFKERPVEVKCPECSHVTDQKARAMRRDNPLKCAYCSLIFLPSDCSCIGG
ncbi:TPA: YnfU family zinc-binding protein [Raoultella planticola]